MDNNKISLAMSESKSSMSASYNNFVPKKGTTSTTSKKIQDFKKIKTCLEIVPAKRGNISAFTTRGKKTHTNKKALTEHYYSTH